MKKLLFRPFLTWKIKLFHPNWPSAIVCRFWKPARANITRFWKAFAKFKSFQRQQIRKFLYNIELRAKFRKLWLSAGLSYPRPAKLFHFQSVIIIMSCPCPLNIDGFQIMYVYKKIVHFYVCIHDKIGLDMHRYVRKNEAKVECISFIFACFMIIVESHSAAWTDIYRNTSTLAP